DHDVPGKDYHHAGHITVELFKRVLPANNYEFYICGPPSMMESLTQGLMSWGVPAEKIFFEAFGPATVKRATSAPIPLDDGPGIDVTFAKSGKKCPWNPKAGSLLDFAESNGIAIDFGCRAGNCGTCLTAIKEGEVTYLTDPGTMPEAGSCLTCISVPKGQVTLDA
ncbi:MAG: 2Fe-2S iron-sulfur cluster-binding protein, partial [Nitrospirales bacterium]|nr:2Fe-2S iron-sulfur cluster-binding protein [Nitrospirales bacterium]